MVSDTAISGQLTLAAGLQPPVAPPDDNFRIISASGVFRACDPQMGYFWTPEWQAGEHEADEDIRAGRLLQFDNPGDALEFLRGL